MLGVILRFVMSYISVSLIFAVCFAGWCWWRRRRRRRKKEGGEEKGRGVRMCDLGDMSVMENADDGMDGEPDFTRHD